MTASGRYGTLTLRMPRRWYPRFKRVMWRWVYSATFSGGHATVQLRRRDRACLGEAERENERLREAIREARDHIPDEDDPVDLILAEALRNAR